ncbi:hypothetical protein GGI15_002443 [Coemansia interrupta]|uniref:Oligopeptide transporter n=1 Tax=Coemansia interrupta TaxID=1126814 RepID=A0A9W8HH23_9FUNG|nr:hypothetical protein GGI15_002443 [Coemansia interrupta]
MYYWFRSNPITLGIPVVQLLSLPAGWIMSQVLPKHTFNTFGFRWSLNPGPFSVKEHVLISIFANASTGTTYALDIIVARKFWIGPPLTFGAGVLLALTSQLIGYSFSGIFHRFLVVPDAMLFWAAFALSFAWYFVPGWFFPTLTMLPILCFIAPNNIYANQLGDGYSGLGMLALTLDWSTISNVYTGSPLATPWFAACNLFVGFVLVMWVITPIAYYSNAWDAKSLPIYTNTLFASDGSEYNVSRVLRDGKLDPAAYEAYSPMNMSFQFLLMYGFCFMGITCLLSHVVLNHGPDLWQSIQRLAGLLTLPVGLVEAVSNFQYALGVITELIAGYIWPGQPTYNASFKMFGYITMKQSLMLTKDQKLGRYMRIPPRHLFICQVLGTVIAVFVQLGTSFWLMDSVQNICTDDGFPFTCRQGRLFYSTMVIWGVIGPQRQFGGRYGVLYWMFLVGVFLPLPFWLLRRRYPRSIWRHVNIPVALTYIGYMPNAPTHDFVMFTLFCFIFNYVLMKYRSAWWQKYNFTLTAALDSGLAVSGIIGYFALQNVHVSWWGTKNHCPLSKQPFTASSSPR